MKFESQLAGGIALYDARRDMPTHESNRYPRRPIMGIKRVYVHHSGGLGSAGLRGARSSAWYSVITHGWPGAAYHYWIPARPVLDDRSNLCVLRMQSDGVRSWHTGGKANGHGVSVCLQGNTTERPLTASHVECLEALLPWLRERHDLSGEWLSWHSDSKRFGGSGKSACPGKHAEDWLRQYRREMETDG